MGKNVLNGFHLETGCFEDCLNLLFPSCQAAVKFPVRLNLFIETAGNLIGRRLHLIDAGINPADRNALFFHRRHNRSNRA